MTTFETRRFTGTITEIREDGMRRVQVDGVPEHLQVMLLSPRQTSPCVGVGSVGTIVHVRTGSSSLWHFEETF